MNSRAFAAAGVSIMALGVATQSATAEELVVGTFGGNFSKAVAECHIAPFEAATGDTVAVQEGNSSQLAAMVRATAGDSDFDVIYIDNSFASQLAGEGLLEKLDRTALSSAPDLVDGVFGPDDLYVQFQWGATAIAYNPDAFPTPPDSWAAVFDPANAGKIALPDISGTAGVHFLLAAARLNGGDIDNLDPGFEAVKAITPGVVAYYTQADQIISMFERGEITLAPWYPDRAAAAADAGLNIAVAYPKEGAIGIQVTAIIPKGAENPAAALKYIDTMLSVQGQTCLAEKMYSGPVNKAVTLPEKVERAIPSSEFGKLYFPDPATVAANVADWRQRWQREISR